MLCPACGGSIAAGMRACPYCGSTVATRRCPACLGWNLEGAIHCQGCGQLLPSGPDRERALAYPCPRCQGALVARQYAETSVDECDHCGGLFLTPATMERVVAAHDQATGLRLALPKREAKRELGVRYLHCPVCGKLMNRQAFARISGVVVDVCRSHGVWFDAGELAEVIQFVAKGGLARARERESEELAERARRARVQDRASQSVPGVGHEDGDLGGHLGLVEPDASAEILRFIAGLWR
ncbi:MAG: zf-TFIIB domain-containing protein [Polyangia bacterium]